MNKIRIAILASGSGSNAEAIMKWAKYSDWVEVVCVLSDRRDALVLSRAHNLNVTSLYVKKKKEESRAEYDHKLIVVLSDYSPDWIVLAGYMKILTPSFLNVFKNKVINIHPSLLPFFPGKDGYGDAFRAGVEESGCTIHYVDEGVDTGLIIAQRKFPKISGETFEDFKKRGLKNENEFYPEILEKIFRKTI